MDEAARARRNKAVEFNNLVPATVAAKDATSAYRQLCSATVVDPTMAQGWYGLGNATADLGMGAASVAAFRRVLALPDGPFSGDCTPALRVKALVNLGHRLVHFGKPEEARDVTAQAIRMLEADPALDPEGRAFAWTNMSLALSVLGETEESLKFARHAWGMSQDPVIELGLAFALLYAGRYAAGLKHFEARFAWKLPQFLNYPYARWDGKPVGTLLVEADQGLGDTVSFARFVPSAASRAERLLFRVQPEAVRFMRAAMAPWPSVEVIPQSTVFPLADAWCPVMSLPAALDLTDTHIRRASQQWKAPPAPGVRPEWKAHGPKLHVGVAYAGSPLNDTDRWRSVPVDLFLELYRVPGVQLYSLQVGDRVKDLHDAGMASLARDLSPWIRDISDTAEIVRHLDLVVTIESFVGHLCGALDVPCWVLVARNAGDWRIGRSGDTALWYPRHRLFRQGADARWEPVMAAVAEALGRWRT